MASSSRGNQQDSIVEDDEELLCPLCVEEFDLSDRNFKPCPCGYQVCQFCFNNIKTNMNGLCPACRRPYDEKTMEFKIVTPEEIAEFKANAQRNAKRKAELRQKEAQKREVETLNKKHLAGLRVVQKNLVYVVGLSPGIPEQDLLQTLRGDKYFGQYGKIIKIVVSKAKAGDSATNSQSLGVYVTFARKEDAERCIVAVNGSQNGDRVLRAQLGTTKYCSAFLRNEPCTNKQCMFLHESGENDESYSSYSRQELSSINSASTQRPLAGASTPGATSRQLAQAQSQAPIQQAQPAAASSQNMAREASKDGSDSGDGSALPSSASWANRGTQNRSRRPSITASAAASSPAISHTMPDLAETTKEHEDEPIAEEIQAPVQHEHNNNLFQPSDPILRRILEAINRLETASMEEQDADSNLASDYPPLFTDDGGLKRRAMREEQEEARLVMEQESHIEPHQVPEPQQEEEEPESGSLQLGGEPEDRDDGREPATQTPGFHDQRRPSAQLPIQRASNDAGLFSGQGFAQNITSLGNLGGASGRSITPAQQQQQMLLAKFSQPQSGFADQFPINGSSQPSLFQQQGHNRQSSRYSFANEAASATSASKTSITPKIPGQQGSMMPQQGNQTYGSMPGPPPGLKSTGTPVNGGGMFGQSHGFGGALGGSGFAVKENGNELLREMLRRGGATGGGQAYDASKREFMFPSFLHQYPPTSSTPAPASGLLASLNGHHHGAFHDFGPKQKKKGKKHRHANTSSSGGGGLVDLADPNILQARMPHQQQSNAGGGQGLFGGQAQGGYNQNMMYGDDQDLPSLDEASESVDALVADDFTISDIASHMGSYDIGSRSSTPSVPPGFDLPHAHPSPSREDPIAKPISRIVPTSAPFTPSRSVSSAYIPRAATPLSNMSVPTTPVQHAAVPRLIDLNTLHAKQEVRSLAINSGLSNVIASQAALGTSQQVLQPEDFPSLDKGKGKESATSSGPKITTPKKAVSSVSLPTGPAPSSASKTNAKKPVPGVLNISAAIHSPIKPTSSSETPVKATSGVTAFPPLPPSTPSASTSAARVPKTLRVVPTPKTENPPPISSNPPSAVSAFPPSFPPTRQPSIASISKIDRPSTPASEIISDNASVGSASISRPGSPPLSRIGSAPVRTTTKSQQKKQRKEKSELTTLVDRPEAEVEIAPILGRKKKQKKEKQSSAAGGSTPAVSRPVSPGAQQASEQAKQRKPDIVVEVKQVAPMKSPVAEVAAASNEKKGKAKAKVEKEEVALPEAPTPPMEVVEDVAQKSLPTPSSILQDLVSSGLLPDPNSLTVLKPPMGFNQRSEFSGDLHGFDGKLIITEEDRATLAAGRPVHKNVEGSYRMMLTPNGDCVRNLTPAEEERYLQLQARIFKETGPAAFVPARHNAGSGFTLIGGRAVPNGPPAFLPPSDNNPLVASMDPVSKIQRDEALSYINQYVLPSLSQNSQLERALNAWGPEMAQAQYSQSWGGWGAGNGPDGLGNQGEHQNEADTPYGSNSQNEGILATGLESMTAHFAVGRDNGRGQPLGNVTLLSLADSESAMQAAKKETEKLEKSLNQLLKKNRRLLLGTTH